MLLEPFVMAFVDMPFLSLCAKITPKRVEGSVFALLMGIRNFQVSVLAPMVGSSINDWFFHVTSDNISDENMMQICIFDLWVVLLPILILKLIPLRKTVAYV